MKYTLGANRTLRLKNSDIIPLIHRNGVDGVDGVSEERAEDEEGEQH